MTQPQKYLYCIIPCAEERTFPEVAPIGGGDEPVHTVNHRGLAAVVSDSPMPSYETTRANMLVHQRVLESVMQEYPLLPVRFGTITDGSSPLADIERLLERRCQEFDQLLAEMAGKVELGVKALWRDEKATFEEILAESPRLLRLRNTLEGKPPQATYFDRLRLGQMVKEALERKRSAEAASLLTPLRKVAHRVVENPILVDKIVLNAAFLIDRQREVAFDHSISQLEETQGHRFAFKYIGPVPPYNFVNIVVNWHEE